MKNFVISGIAALAILPAAAEAAPTAQEAAICMAMSQVIVEHGLDYAETSEGVAVITIAASNPQVQEMGAKMSAGWDKWEPVLKQKSAEGDQMATSVLFCIESNQ